MDRPAEHEVEQRVDVVSTERFKIDPNHVVTPPQGRHDRVHDRRGAHGRDEEHLTAVQELGEQPHGRRIEMLKIIDVHHEPTLPVREAVDDLSISIDGIVTGENPGREQVRERPERHRRRDRGRTRPDNDAALSLGALHQLRRQTRLADTGGTMDHHSRPRAVPQGIAGTGQLLVATYELPTIVRPRRALFVSYAFSSGHSTSTTGKQWPP